MRISRFYCEQRLQRGATLHLDKEAGHYIRTVLRHAPGDPLLIFNPLDGEYQAVIKHAGKQELVVQLDEQLRPAEALSLPIHLGQGIARGEKMDLIIQKATELGVSEISPLFSEHCNVKLNAERRIKRTEHWQKIAINASEQCGRISVPVVHAPMPLKEWQLARQEPLKLLCHPHEQQFQTQIHPKSMVLLIGPEGGLSDHERGELYEQGWQNFSLGPRILRTETASLVALSVLQSRYGDLQS